jgi:hypothetical protein
MGRRRHAVRCRTVRRLPVAPSSTAPSVACVAGLAALLAVGVATDRPATPDTGIVVQRWHWDRQGVDVYALVIRYGDQGSDQVVRVAANTWVNCQEAWTWDTRTGTCRMPEVTR